MVTLSTKNVLIINCERNKPEWNGIIIPTWIWKFLGFCIWKPWCLYICHCKVVQCVTVLSCEGVLECVWSEQNAAIVLWLNSSQWSLCQVRHTALVWQPAELCEPRALWARHWTTGLRSSGSLSVQRSTPGRPGLSLRQTLFHRLSGLSAFPLTSHISSFLQGQGCSDFWWRRETTSSVSVLNFLGKWIKAHFLPFPSLSSLWSSMSVSGTVKYLTAVSPVYLTFWLLKANANFWIKAGHGIPPLSSASKILHSQYLYRTDLWTSLAGATGYTKRLFKHLTNKKKEEFIIKTKRYPHTVHISCTT